MSQLPITIRAADAKDMVEVAAIYKHYVLNTVATFAMEQLSTEQQVEILQKVQNQHLPYLVAILNDDQLVGYCYVSGFRGGKAAYRHTVELSLYCARDFVGRGIGSALLTRLLSILSNPEQYRDEFLYGAVRAEDARIRHIIIVMAVDTDGKDGGLGLKKYYEGFGFELQGHLKQVGHKLGRWVDTMYLQKTLW